MLLKIIATNFINSLIAVMTLDTDIVVKICNMNYITTGYTIGVVQADCVERRSMHIVTTRFSENPS